jgi:CheY-like chemotaxis protein
VEIGISDTGIGISKEFLPHIFETFRQEDTGTARSADGLGLGLAIVKRIVNLHGGTVSAQSEGKDKGTAFIVRLPLASLNEIDKQDGKQSASLPAGILRAVRVLIVDDDADARFLLTRILNAYGAVVSEAGSAMEALDYVRVTSPQVMISDIGLPGDDGYELIRQVRATGYDAKRLPAVALTAFARPEDRMRALSNGFQVHFGKPMDPYNMVRTISDLIGRPGASGPSS